MRNRKKNSEIWIFWTFVFFVADERFLLKKKMVTPYMKAELTAAVTSLGYTEGPKYFKDQYCLGE